ncbi:hypothetical protein CANARDRAFT_4995 [[Candida] arabinofermentans NRRL YB-2248]|uniref:Uncharacterized protein n=1 Tax=[Candida] arabinofermentans NRRL YB-2248 TaxID=983967 RepID=A0A1E4T7G1_9ASCO|nr:hypothetical protein CANARDRAFT_4995 [[Candida] arabinofermentans NRRL YB-2248]
MTQSASTAKAIRKLKYLSLLVLGPKDLERISRLRPLDKQRGWVLRLQQELSPLQLQLFNAFRNFTRLYATLLTALMIAAKFQPIKKKSIIKFTSSVSLVLTLNPLLKRVFANDQSLASNIIPNLLTSLPLAIYPVDPRFQKNYISIYLLILVFEHGYKLIECLNSKIASKRHLLKPLNQSWLIFPLCYSIIYDDYISNKSHCPKYFVQALDFLKEDLSMNRENFVKVYLPEKLLSSFKRIYPSFLALDIKDKKTLEPEMLVMALRKAFKAIFTGLFISSTSFYLSYKSRFSTLKVNRKFQQRLNGFVSSLIILIYEGEDLRSFWLYILRMTLLSHFKRFKYKLDKILIITNLTLLLTVNNIYKKKPHLTDTISQNRSLNTLLETIESGSLLS